jgi:hypothetical protein
MVAQGQEVKETGACHDILERGDQCGVGLSGLGLGLCRTSHVKSWEDQKACSLSKRESVSV